MSNQIQRQSRWGAAPPPPQHQQPPAAVGNGGGGAPSQQQPWNDNRRGGRGYETADAPRVGGPPHDDSRGRGGRWGGQAGGDRWQGGGDDRGGRPSYDNGRYQNNERHHDGRGDWQMGMEELNQYGRGGEPDQFGRGDQRDQHGTGDGGWRCMECELFNDPRDERCPRCRTWRTSGGGPPRDRRSVDDADRYTFNDGRERGADGDDGRHGPRGNRRGRDSDEYNGRRPRGKSRDETPRKREWPPHFESSGASFIFDARSGMFYEPRSDFFYDPKTKLYYGNKKKQYFRYEEDKRPYFFQPVGGEGNGASGQQQGQAGGMVTQQVVTAAEEMSGGAPPEPSAAAAQPEKAEPKQKIAISLKTAMPPKDANAKSLSDVAAAERAKLKEKNIQRKESALSSAVEINNAAPAALPQSHKKHAKDMNKWSERVKEMRDDDADDEEAKPPAKKVKTTASGQPICVLCRRKFANLEKLVQHEKLSALHKENLAKKAAAADAERKAKKDSDANYRDRSKERRMMYGSHSGAADSSSHAEALLAHSLGTGASAESKPAEVVRPEETLNDNNVGNKLLQKLGWKSGGGLGRNAGQDAVGKEGATSDNLKSDWERIESLAQRGGRR